MSKRHDFFGADTIEIAEKYGTPLYLISEEYIVERCKEIQNDFLKTYDNTFAVYAGKAFLTKEMCRIMKREGIGLDVVSGGELLTAISTDFEPENIILHGNNKSDMELELAVKNGVGRIVVDHLSEIDQINNLGKMHTRQIKVLLRITPGIAGDTHQYISTGQVDSKFGIPLEKDMLFSAIKRIMSYEHVEIIGFHFHVGSQLFEKKPYLEATKVLLDLIFELKQKIGFETKELDVGGGYGIKYRNSEVRKPLVFYVQPIMELIEERCKTLNLKRPKIIIEPGRWIVGEAGITLYTIGSIKEIPNVRTYVSIDGGMPDNPRPALYDAEYDAFIANKHGIDASNLVTISGKCCESGDILIRDLMLPKPERGDILVVKSTGAYNYSMASNYNKIPVPAVLMVNNGMERLIVRRQTHEDMISREI